MKHTLQHSDFAVTGCSCNAWTLHAFRIIASVSFSQMIGQGPGRHAITCFTQQTALASLLLKLLCAAKRAGIQVVSTDGVAGKTASPVAQRRATTVACATQPPAAAAPFVAVIAC